MASNQPLVDRTEAVYRELRSMRMRFRVGAWITLIVGGLLLLLVAFYFSYGYKEVSSFRDPDLIVSLVGDMADQQIPALKKMAQDQVNQNASVWAEQASQQVLEQVEPIRKQIESLALQQADKAIAKIDVVGEQKFREILEQNRETVQNAIDQLKSDEEISEGAVVALKEAIEKEFQIDADSQVDALVTMVSDVNANMEKLAAGEDLSREQKAERRVLMLARRIHVDRFGDMTTEDLAGTVPVINEVVENLETNRLRKEAKEASGGALAGDDADMTPDKPEEKAADKPKEEAKPAAEDKPAEKPEKKETPAKEKPADKPKEEAKAAEKAEEVAKEDKPAEKPEEKMEAKAEEKPADKPKEEAKPAKEAEEGDKPAEKADEKEAEEKKEAS